MLLFSEEIEKSIVIETMTDDDEKYSYVSRLYKLPKKEEGNFAQAIEFTSWRNCLGMDMSAASYKVFQKRLFKK